MHSGRAFNEQLVYSYEVLEFLHYMQCNIIIEKNLQNLTIAYDKFSIAFSVLLAILKKGYFKVIWIKICHLKSKKFRIKLPPWLNISKSYKFICISSYFGRAGFNFIKIDKMTPNRYFTVKKNYFSSAVLEIFLYKQTHSYTS